MNSISERFPVIIMTRNDAELLKKCVISMLKTVTIEIQIYIVDNKSNDTRHCEILRELEQNNYNVEVIHKKNNLWILGVNDTIKLIKTRHSHKYFFLTDGDIDFSNCLAKPCWLTYLIERMNNNISLGKIGYSLDWRYLKQHEKLGNVLNQETTLYSETHKINDLYVSFIDTTATLFRNDWSINPSSGLYPDHMRYLRPELYSCRTSKDLVVEHLGWYLYNNTSKLNVKYVNEKILCFLFTGGDIKDEILDVADKKYKWSYKIFAKNIRRLWFLRRYYFFIKYMFMKGIRHFDGQGYIWK